MDGYFDFQAEFLIVENGSDILYPSFAYGEPLYNGRYRYFWGHERGLGWALKQGIQSASWPYVFFLPADLSYDLCFVKQAKAYLETGYSLVIGSKALHDSQVKRPLKRKAISAAYNLSLRTLYGHQWPRDITGTKAYRKRDIAPLLSRCDSNGIYFEVQLMKAVINARLRSKEIAVTVKDLRPSRFNPLTRHTEAHAPDAIDPPVQSTGS